MTWLLACDDGLNSTCMAVVTFTSQDGKGQSVLRGLPSYYATDAPKCSINECFGQHCVLRLVWRRGSTKAGEAGRRD